MPLLLELYTYHTSLTETGKETQAGDFWSRAGYLLPCNRGFMVHVPVP